MQQERERYGRCEVLARRCGVVCVAESRQEPIKVTGTQVVAGRPAAMSQIGEVQGEIVLSQLGRKENMSAGMLTSTEGEQAGFPVLQPCWVGNPGWGRGKKEPERRRTKTVVGRTARASSLLCLMGRPGLECLSGVCHMQHHENRVGTGNVCSRAGRRR